jgi:hypothetical protein
VPKAYNQIESTISLKREWEFSELLRTISKIFKVGRPLHLLKATPAEWTSFTQLIQELIGGAVRRNLFTHWELDLLLDLQMAKVRKSSRADVLRRYLRVVMQSQAQGTSEPLRLEAFLAQGTKGKAAAGGVSE